MCGIFGVHGPLSNDVERLRTIANTQRHRGPDGFGDWRSEGGGVYFAHNRLAIIDLSIASSQPFHTAHGVLLFNGEIYNYLELRDALTKQGVAFATTGDTEVLALVIAHWGFEGLHRVRGMFAIAYYRHS